MVDFIANLREGGGVGVHNIPAVAFERIDFHLYAEIPRAQGNQYGITSGHDGCDYCIYFCFSFHFKFPF